MGVVGIDGVARGTGRGMECDELWNTCDALWENFIVLKCLLIVSFGSV